MKNQHLLLIFCAIQICVNAQENVSIGKIKKIESKILGGEVTYLEHLPDGYEKSGKPYPVLFMMNGQITPQFANAGATLDNLSNDRIPDMILIGISNTGAARNYRSCPNDSGYIRGGESFHTFLKDELIPEIEKNYRTNGYRILAGQSNSGLYVMYNFLYYPELFHAYIITSPMFGWCPEFFLDKTKSFLKDHPEINKKLYIAYGDLDYVQVLNHIKEYEETLKQAPINMQWKVELIVNAGHVPFASMNNALLFFFAGCTMNAERRKLRVPEIKSHYEALSKEYGFSVNPKAGALFDIAIDLGAEQKLDEAIEMNKYLISLYPDSEDFVFHLGTLYQKNGELESAKEQFNNALKINPNYERAKAALNKVSIK